MITLPNNCRCSNPSVFPKNWKTCTTTGLTKTWRIQYYFYDDLSGDSKLIVVKAGLNRLKSLNERRMAVKELLEQELSLLKDQGYNPISKEFSNSFNESFELDPETPFIDALKWAHDRLDVAKITSMDIGYCINNLQEAALKLRYSSSITTFKRRHLRMLLDVITKTKKISNNRYNKHLANLSIVFKQLIEVEAIEYNPTKDIARRKTIKRIRAVLTAAERKLVNTHLRTNYYTFWRFCIIFFHSGGRTTELLSIKREDIKLADQTYKVLIKKGRQKKEVVRVIKDVVHGLWHEVLTEASPGEYLFSKGLIPGSQKIRRDQISRRWKVHVKQKLGIECDFYALKHLNLDETTNLLSISDASRMASHTSTRMIEKHYAVGEKERQLQRLKKLSNTFGDDV